MYWQATTHVKSLAKRGNLNEGRAKAARAYKAKVASLTSEWAELRARMQNMMEEAVKLKSDLRHTLTARAWAEGREEKAREGLRVAEGKLREVRDGLQTAQNELRVVRDGLQTAQNELRVVREELQTAQNELRVVREELQAAGDELRNKAVLVDRARCEASEVESSIECLTDECHALQGDLQRQEALVIQRDGAITSLRDEGCTQWAFG